MNTGLIDETQVKLHFEHANMGGEAVERGAGLIITGAVNAGTALANAKELIPHGEWSQWLAKHWDYSQTKASRYMTIAANYSRANNLKDAKSIREALRMIAAEDNEPETIIVPRAERKTGRVEVVKPDRQEQPEQTVGQPEDENAVPPEPKTNTKHSKDTTKVSEADKPKTAPITPEIIDEPSTGPDDAVAAYLEVVSPVQIVRDALTRISDDGLRVKEVRRIRKELDKFDPPTSGAPTIESVREWAMESGMPEFDADKFFNHYELAGWKYGKAKTPIKDWKRAAVNAYGRGAGWAVDGSNRLPF